MEGDFPGGPVVKNLPRNAGDEGSIPGMGWPIPHDPEQLNLWATTREQLEDLWLQQKIPHDTIKTPCASTKNWHRQIN